MQDVVRGKVGSPRVIIPRLSEGTGRHCLREGKRAGIGLLLGPEEGMAKASAWRQTAPNPYMGRREWRVLRKGRGCTLLDRSDHSATCEKCVSVLGVIARPLSSSIRRSHESNSTTYSRHQFPNGVLGNRKLRWGNVQCLQSRVLDDQSHVVVASQCRRHARPGRRSPRNDAEAGTRFSENPWRFYTSRRRTGSIRRRRRAGGCPLAPNGRESSLPPVTFSADRPAVFVC